eukprot:2911531-Pleurochrysis_carterae.AAC.4
MSHPYELGLSTGWTLRSNGPWYGQELAFCVSVRQPANGCWCVRAALGLASCWDYNLHASTVWSESVGHPLPKTQNSRWPVRFARADLLTNSASPAIDGQRLLNVSDTQIPLTVRILKVACRKVYDGAQTVASYI